MGPAAPLQEEEVHVAQSRVPRHPVVLDAARVDAIIGDEGPVANTAVAHTAAWAPMGVGDETFTDADVAHLRETMRTSGVNTIVHVWSRSPGFTLPGALWCVHLLHEWYRRDPLLVTERYAEGPRTSVIQGLKAPVELRPLSLIMEEVDSLLRGDLTDDNLEYVLGETSHAIHVLAASEARALQIEDPIDPPAHRITMRHSAPLITADGLNVVAREAVADAFDWPRVRCVVADLGVPWVVSWRARTGIT